MKTKDRLLAPKRQLLSGQTGSHQTHPAPRRQPHGDRSWNAVSEAQPRPQESGSAFTKIPGSQDSQTLGGSNGCHILLPAKIHLPLVIPVLETGLAESTLQN